MKIIKPKFWDKSYPTLYSLILWPISQLYRLIIFLKSFFINNKKFSVPIICVGNIYIGGTGKTPLSIKISELLQNERKPVILKKNYKNHVDEIELIKKYSKIIVCDKRESGINTALNKNYDVVIMDDGYQDRSIKKDLNIICFNDAQKIGNGQTFPAGPLRENLSTLINCNIVMINGKKNIQFEEKLKKYKRNLEFFYFNYKLKNFEQFKNKKLICFAGIGNPQNFFDLLKANRLNVIKEISFPDHYKYSEKELEELIGLEEKYNAKLVTTEKDYLRISPFNRRRFGVINIKVNIQRENEIFKFIEKVFK